MTRSKPVSDADLHERVGRRKDDLRKIATGLVTLIALGFSDLTSTIAQGGGTRQLLAVFVTAILLAGLGLAYSWPWFDRVQRETKSAVPEQPPTGDFLKRYNRAWAAGQLAILSIFVGASCYLVATWIWAT